MQTIQYSEFKKRYDVNFRAKPNDDDFIGAGGFGQVFKGYDKLKHIPVAIKRSPTDKNLLEEVEKAKQLPQHVNIARYLEGFRIETEADDFDVAILQYYSKGNLNQLISSGLLNNKQIHDLIVGILEGISFLHKGFTDSNGKHRSIIHRDLKPQNILIAEYKGVYTPLITDFGISKLVQAEDIHSTGGVELSNQMGTMMYKAPEQVLGGTVRNNLDLWAFGIILFKMLTGKLPFNADTQMSTEAILTKITKSDLEEIFIQLKNYPEVYQQIIRKCLVRDIKNRVQTADELITMLKVLKKVTEEKTEKTEKNITINYLEEKTDDRVEVEGEPLKLKNEKVTYPVRQKEEIPLKNINTDSDKVSKEFPWWATILLIIIISCLVFSISNKYDTTIQNSSTEYAGYGIQTTIDFDLPNTKDSLDTSDSLVKEMLYSMKILKNQDIAIIPMVYCDEIYFNDNSPVLKEEDSKEQLYRIFSVLEAYPNLRIQLTKTLYLKDVNNHDKKKLWIKRLESVKKSFVEIGIKESRILLKVNEEKFVDGIIKTNSENKGIAIEI